jgi:hypothetical protein
MAVNNMDISSTKYNGQSSSRFYNHQWSIIAEINRSLDNQESIEVEDPRQNTGPTTESNIKSPSHHIYKHHVHGYDAEFPDIKPVEPETPDDTGVPDLHSMEPETPDFTTRFQYYSFSRGPLMCRQIPCMGHPPKTTQSSTPTLLSVSEIKEEVKTEKN